MLQSMESQRVGHDLVTEHHHQDIRLVEIVHIKNTIPLAPLHMEGVQRSCPDHFHMGNEGLVISGITVPSSALGTVASQHSPWRFMPTSAAWMRRDRAFCLPLFKHRPDFLAVAGAGGQRITGAELLESILHDVPTHSTLSLAYVPRTRLRLSAAGGGECLGGIKH